MGCVQRDVRPNTRSAVSARGVEVQYRCKRLVPDPEQRTDKRMLQLHPMCDPEASGVSVHTATLHRTLLPAR